MAIIFFQPHNKIDLLRYPNRTHLKIYNYPSTYHHFNTPVFNCLRYTTLIKHNFYFDNDNGSGLSIELQCDDQNRFRILYGFKYDKFEKMKLPNDFFESLNEYSFAHHSLIDQGYTSYDVLFGHCKEYYPKNHNQSYISNSIGLNLYFNNGIQSVSTNSLTSSSLAKRTTTTSTLKSTKLLAPPPLPQYQQKQDQLMIDNNSFKFNKLDEEMLLDPYNEKYHPQFPTCQIIELHNEKLNNAFKSVKPTTTTTTTTTTTSTTLQ